MNIKDLFFLVSGGATGTLLRYFVSYNLFERYFRFITPWPTLLVNTLGSFLIGFLYEFCCYDSCSLGFKKIIFIGFLGAFTTFSTYGLEVINLFKLGKYQLALAYVVLSNIGCLLMVLFGMWLAKNILVLIR